MIEGSVSQVTGGSQAQLASIPGPRNSAALSILASQRIVASMSDWITRLAGRFLVFDGPDGSGKATQFARCADHCREAGIGVCEVREPGGTKIGEQIRAVLLDPANTDMSLRCEMMLYMASRAELVEHYIRPALARGDLVIADRFISSTLAYQGTGGGLDQQEILDVGRVAVGSTWPDLTVIFDVDGATAAKRLTGDSKRAATSSFLQATLFSDRVELRGPQYQQAVRQGFLSQAEADPQRHVVIDASAQPDEVFAQLLEQLKHRFS